MPAGLGGTADGIFGGNVRSRGAGILSLRTDWRRSDGWRSITARLAGETAPLSIDSIGETSAERGGDFGRSFVVRRGGIVALFIVIAETPRPADAESAVNAETRGAGVKPELSACSGEAICMLPSLIGVMGFVANFGVPGSSNTWAWFPKGSWSLVLEPSLERSQALGPRARLGTELRFLVVCSPWLGVLKPVKRPVTGRRLRRGAFAGATGLSSKEPDPWNFSSSARCCASTCFFFRMMTK